MDRTTLDKFCAQKKTHFQYPRKRKKKKTEKKTNEKVLELPNGKGFRIEDLSFRVYPCHRLLVWM